VGTTIKNLTCFAGSRGVHDESVPRTTSNLWAVLSLQREQKKKKKKKINSHTFSKQEDLI
jgi:hypothetical protein